MKDSLTQKGLKLIRFWRFDNIEYLVSEIYRIVKNFYSLESGQVNFQWLSINTRWAYAFLNDYVALFHANSKDELAILNTQRDVYFMIKKVLVKKILY